MRQGAYPLILVDVAPENDNCYERPNNELFAPLLYPLPNAVRRKLKRTTIHVIISINVIIIEFNTILIILLIIVIIIILINLLIVIIIILILLLLIIIILIATQDILDDADIQKLGLSKYDRAEFSLLIHEIVLEEEQRQKLRSFLQAYGLQQHLDTVQAIGVTHPDDISR